MRWMQRNGGNKTSEFVFLSEIILRVSVDTGNFLSLKEFGYEFSKPQSFEFSFRTNDNWSSERTCVRCSAKTAQRIAICLYFQMFNVKEVSSVTSQSFSGV